MQHVITPSKSTRTLFVFIISLILLSTLIEAAPAKSNGVSRKRLDELVKFANFASAAYCEPSSFRSGKCGPICDATKGTKVEKSITTRKTGTQVFIATHDEDELIIVSYRGTVRENIANVITDAKIVLSDYPPVEGARVHLGFYQAFLEVQSEVFDVVQRLHRKNPTYKVVYTGHSLGGALTLLSALDLVQNSNDFVKNENLFVFTYGEPRVGNSEFAKHVDSKLKVFRTVNGADSVSRLPPRFLGYRHHSGELWISNPEKSSFDAVECNGPEDINCSLSLPITELSLRLHSGPFYGVSMRACRSRNKSFKASEADQTDLKAFENLGGNLKEPEN